MDKLNKAREIIGEADREIAALFEKRMAAVREVAEYKKERGLPVFDGAREDFLIKKNLEYIEDESIGDFYVSFIKSTMDISKRYQHRILEGANVAYSGVEGAFAHIAAGRIFPDGKRISYPDFKSAYEAVEKGECDCAVLPIENSRAGEVGQVIDLIFSGTLYVNGLYSLDIRHNLIGLADASEKDIVKVISHQQALDQCASYIRNQGYKAEGCENTARAAKLVADMGDKSLAAIASRETADLYGLKVIRENINEANDNTTRFVVLSRTLCTEKRDHSIIVFTVPDEAGALAHAINVIGHHGYSMRSIKSRAMKDLIWTYYFYVEIEGDLQSRRGRYMLDELSDCCDRLKMIGTYKDNSKI
ncbi:MAG: bifunctional chorismate mutase/prephenate dehydratase [Ruminococcaceae bacterium]|nr:bifunctional chorismate mutase/prephenate dehydratase [Oscillospiraceae bacterium]